MPGFQQVPSLWLPPLSAIKQLLPVERGSLPRDKSRQTAALQLGKRDAGRVERAGGCSNMLWFRFIDWKVPSILKLLRCYSVRYRGCIWLRKILEE